MKRAISVHTRDLLDVDFGFESRFRDTSRHTHTHTHKHTNAHVQLYFLCISDAVAESIVFTVNITLRPMRRMQAPFNLIRDITVNVLVPDRRRPHFYVEAFHECAFSCRKSGLGPRYRDRPIFIAIHAIRFLRDFHISKLNVSAFLSKQLSKIDPSCVSLFLFTPLFTLSVSFFLYFSTAL